MLFQIIHQVIQGHYVLCYYKIFYPRHNNLKYYIMT